MLQPLAPPLTHHIDLRLELAGILSSLTAQSTECMPSTPMFAEEMASKEAVLTVPLMSWKNRGEYHLNRNQLDLAIESFTKALQEAEGQQNLEEIGECLKDLGRAFLKKEQWPLAVKALNGALALLQNEKPRRVVLLLMAEAERHFLEKSYRVKKALLPIVYLERRQKLQAFRQASHVKLSQNVPAEKILIDFTQSISLFLSEILENGFSLLGKPPCDYALIGLGSLARKEMSPYSDIEFALLIEKSSQTNLEYFRKLVQWLELQVIHLGETAIKILDNGFESPVVRGFCFDDGGNTPLGKQGYVELIKTPQELAQLQSERFYQEDLILSNVLRGADIITGSESLYKDYTQAMQSLLNTTISPGNIPIYQVRALNILRGHLVEFEPQIDKKKEETPIFNIKVELYRLPSFLIAGLADYFGIGEQNTWKRLDALVQKRILSEEGAQHLKDALAATMHLRIRCHLHYGKETEEVYHPSTQIKVPAKRLQNVFVLSDADLNTLIEIYRVIFPLHRIFKQVCQTGNFAELAKESFYDNSLHAQGQAYEKLCHYSQAKKCYSQVVALNPDDPQILLSLANLFYRLAEFPQAKEYADKALALGNRQNNKTLIAAVFCLQGLICDDLGEAKNAIGYYEKAHQITGSENPILTIFYLKNLGSALKAQGDVTKAVTCYEEALKVGKKIYGNEHPTVASCLNGLGNAWKDLGDAKKAILYIEEALKIGKKIFGNENPSVATCLNNLGMAWHALGEARKAIGYLEEALRIDKKVYGNEHPNIATRLNNLGMAWRALGDTTKAVTYYEEALKIDKKVYGEEHPSVAIRLNNLGMTWKALGNAKKAIPYFEEALKIVKKVYNDKHSHIAIFLCNLGGAWQATGDVKKAMTYFEESLKIHRELLGDEHPHIAINLSNIGNAWNALGEPKKAISCYEEALRIDKKGYGDEHPNVATRLNNLGTACWASGENKKAKDYFVQALRIKTKKYGSAHPDVQVIAQNIAELDMLDKILKDMQI